MSLADLIRKGGLLAVATATPATLATHAPKGERVATVAKVAVASPPCSKLANDPGIVLAGWNVTLPDGVKAETVAKFQAASRALDRQIAAAGGPAADPDRDCWPHSSAMSGQEIETFTVRLASFVGKGLSLEHAERQADRLLKRDREADDRRLCLECQYLRSRPGGWHCGNWRKAGIAVRAADARLSDTLVSALQRCNGFQE